MAEREYYREKEGSLNRLGRDDRWLRAQLQRQGIASAEEVFWGISDGEEVELHMIL